MWSKLINFTHQFPVQNAFPYLDYPIQNRRGDKAMQVWNQLTASDSGLQQYSEPGNLILNGGFENQLLNGGFDWRYQPKDQVEVALDTNEFHRGNRALRMVFKGPATPDAGILEYVAVEPNSAYRFSAYTKAEDITSASGPRIAIQDAYSAESDLLTDDSLGTSGWRQQSGDFKTGPQTNMLAVKIVRVPGNALIKGTFWVDDLRLIKR